MFHIRDNAYSAALWVEEVEIEAYVLDHADYGYNLLENGKDMESGYLLSPKDICTLEILPELIDAGIDSLKIEGRKKSYEYVSIVTKIYRKYIDLAKDKTKKYEVDSEDMKQILQIYNRGGMGTGYFKSRKNIVYAEKPNHLGVFIGKIAKINPKQKQVTIDLEDKIELGDVVSINNETSYISQIVNENIVGEIKNLKNIKKGDKVYKIVSGKLNKKQWEIYKKENRKIDISCRLFTEKNELIMELKNDKICTKTAVELEKTDLNELDKSRVLAQIQKTGGTIFNIKNVKIEVQNLKIPISILNSLRRTALEQFEQNLENSILRKYKEIIEIDISKNNTRAKKTPKINLYLQKFDERIDYSKFNYNKIYVQFKDLMKCKNLKNCVAVLPNIIDENYEKFILQNLSEFDKTEGIMISHISQIELLKNFNINKQLFADYSLNITNNLSQKVLKKYNIEQFTISPELDKNNIVEFSNDLKKEFVAYGRTCLMTSKYCVIGKNSVCNQKCKKNTYELKDRKNFIFPVISDCINCHSRIYNSKALYRNFENLDLDYVRIDILNENESQIQQIIEKIQTQMRKSE